MNPKIISCSSSALLCSNGLRIITKYYTMQTVFTKKLHSCTAHNHTSHNSVTYTLHYFHKFLHRHSARFCEIKETYEYEKIMWRVFMKWHNQQDEANETKPLNLVIMYDTTDLTLLLCILFYRLMAQSIKPNVLIKHSTVNFALLMLLKCILKSHHLWD